MSFAITCVGSGVALAQDPQKNETVITGCLNKDSSGGYTLTDEKTGAKTTVTGPADLEKHSANHTVTLTGTEKKDANGKVILDVAKIQHVSASCKAPSQ
jgi:hypothetical protein